MKLAWDSKTMVDKSDGKYHRERSDQLYHTARWTRLSRAYRQSHPLCKMCQDEGLLTPATCVDHVIPWPVCGVSGFFDTKNFQPLCERHNHIKGQHDKEVIRQWKISGGEGRSESLEGNR